MQAFSKDDAKPLKRPLCKLVFEFSHKKSNMRIYLSQNSGMPPTTNFSVFETKDLIYYPFCDDFGPMDFGSTATFVERLEDKINRIETDTIVYAAEDGPRAFMNAALLLGAYGLIKKELNLSQITRCFQGLDPTLFEPFRDVTQAPADFQLHLIDCWSGIYRAKELMFFKCPSLQDARQWGSINLDEYFQYDDPLNGDLHEVVPGKFVAFMGPKDLGGAEFYDDAIQRTRSFSPKYYIDIFRELGVSTVVRLNEPQYNSADFTSAGLQHFDLPFNDCTAPPPDVVMRFLSIAKAAPGLVAVHCKAGLGRTGTLIALYMMRTMGFTAREAMGWLRVMRPGSVIGEQQHYLCDVERDLKLRAIQQQRLRRPAEQKRKSRPAAQLRGPLPQLPGVNPNQHSAVPERQSSEAAAERAVQVAAGMARRGAARIAGTMSLSPSHGKALPALEPLTTVGR